MSTIDKITRIPKRTQLYSIVAIDRVNSMIEIPRYRIDLLESKNYIKNIFNELKQGERMMHEYIGKSNPNQMIVVKAIIDQFRDNPKYSGVTLQMQAGTGKSFTAMDIISKVRRKTLIVVPNTYLLNQWVKILTEFFPTATIGELYGKRKIDGDIIVGIINTVADLESFEVTERVVENAKKVKRKSTVMIDDLFKRIGLTIFDESQMYVSKEFRKAFQRIHSRFTIGLSATPNIREDKLDIIHTSWLGNIMNASELEHYSAEQDSFESTAKLIQYYGLDEHVTYKIRDDGMMEYQSIVESLVNDPNRNKLIISNIMELAKKGQYVFVFSDRRSHLEHLYDTIKDESDNGVP